jgi:tetratricopeptide (TPR) repeat protein
VISKIQHYIAEKSFSFSIQILLQEYPSLSAKERIDYDPVISILSFWQNYEGSYSYKTPLEIDTLWQEFDNFLLEKSIFHHFDIISLVAQTIMKDVVIKLSQKTIQPQDSSPFSKKILYSKSLIWTNNVKDAFFFLSSLIRYYPSEPEPWALLGKIYALLGEEKKSVLFYREAFFINPSILNLIDIRCGLLNSLLLHTNNQLGEMTSQIEKKIFLQWVAIYGVIENFFSQKKRLSLEEKNILQKRIVVYENKHAKASSQEKEESFLNLLRMYLFNYDYHKDYKQNSLAKETLKKIEILSPLVFSKLSP